MIDDKGYQKRKTNKPSQWPYPNPIKLLSREVQKEIKGDYLNAEVMRKGISLQISDIRPNTNIESEIFPRELTKEAQAKEVFTPPGHPQMRFVNQSSKPDQEETAFFITEDIRDGYKGVEQIQEEKSYGSEAVQDQDQEGDSQDEGDQDQDHDGMQEEDEEQYGPEEDEEFDDEEFDFGKAKMDFFKQRARQILVQESEVPIHERYMGEEDEYAYDGKPLQLKLCYQQLKNLIKRPAASYGQSDAERPNYMKMTFAMSRSVAPNSKILQLSGMDASLKKLAKKETMDKELNAHSSSDITLLKQLKGGSEFSMKPTQMLTEPLKKKSKREEAIDSKIEKLLITYKKKDEIAAKKANNLNADKALGKRNLLEKFGFSDDEDAVQ